MSGSRRKESHLTGLRVRLRTEREADAELVDALKGALPACADMTERLIVERILDKDVVGFVEFSRGEPEKGWATFGPIVMAEGERGWGYGSEAVRLIEDDLAASENTTAFRAQLSKSMGLAFYFWLRQGYYPPKPGEVFWPADSEGDMIWVVRRSSQ